MFDSVNKKNSNDSKTEINKDDINAQIENNFTSVSKKRFTFSDSELKKIISDVESDRDEKDKWLQLLSLSIALMALLTTFADYFSDKLSGDSAGLKADSVLIRNEATNLWTYYQAKVLREKMYSIAGEIKDDKNFRETAIRYSEEKQDIKAQAKQKDKIWKEKSDLSDHLYEVHRIFAFSIGFFQTAIALGSVATLTRSRNIWYFSLLLTLIGTVVIGYGFLSW
jgi:hypothetical protein